MMTRLKWLFIGFVAGAMFGAASAKYDVAGPVKSRIGSMRGGCCCADDEAGDQGAPGDGADTEAAAAADATGADAAPVVELMRAAGGRAQRARPPQARWRRRPGTNGGDPQRRLS